MSKLILIILLLSIVITALVNNAFNIKYVYNQIETFILILVIVSIIFYFIYNDKKKKLDTEISNNSINEIVNVLENNLIKFGVICIFIVIFIHFFIKVIIYGPLSMDGLIIIGTFLVLLIIFICVKSIFNDMKTLNSL